MDGACLELTGKQVARGATSPGSDNLILVHRAQAGDRDAFDALVRLYDRDVLRLATRMTGSPEEAADVYQETFLKVYRSIGNFRFQSSFPTWLYRVTVNICLDHLRKRNRRMEIPAPVREGEKEEFFHGVADDRPGLDPERTLQASEIGRRVQAALARLTPRERMVFELRHYEGLRLRAIGELCGASEETAKNCLFRATQKLRLALGDLV
ncbi:MAG: sigma-70 family RNA polymerase sigma factor [Acidobacteriota bacterium]|nr:sigma-70 family RNA polymerase sigma factor [Acidobacteriota bacterium]